MEDTPWLVQDKMSHNDARNEMETHSKHSSDDFLHYSNAMNPARKMSEAIEKNSYAAFQKKNLTEKSFNQACLL